MKQIEIKPVYNIPSDWDDIEDAIRQLFRDQIYLPLLALLNLPNKILKNAKEDLVSAITRGTITYYGGMLQGRFTAALSKEIKALGGKWNKREQGWAINLRQLPTEVRIAISIGQVKTREVLRKIDKFLGDVDPEKVAESVKFNRKLQGLFDATLHKFDKKIGETVKGLTVAPTLTPSIRAKIAEDYSNSLKLPIKDFTLKETVKLREKVQKHAYAGYRHEVLVKEIKKSYQVSAHKAKFLARQETNLLMASFKKARYTDIGIKQYKWRCVIGSKEHPVRPMHQKLNDRSLKGELFDFNNPPIDDPDGSRHNPMENYNCRCVAIPVVKF